MQLHRENDKPVSPIYPLPTQDVGGGSGRVASASFMVAAAAYGAGDCIGTAQELANLGPASGCEILVTSVVLEVHEAALQSGESGYRLHLYNALPPSGHGDNDAWDLPAGDRASHLATITIGAPLDLGSTLKIETDSIQKAVTVPAGGSLYAELVTSGAFTATAAARKVTVHAVVL